MAFSFYSRKSEGQVFLDETKRRKWYVRGSVVTVVGIFFVCLVLALAGFGLFASHRDPISYRSAIERYHYYYSGANAKKVAITIDDGPHAPASEPIMNALADAGAPATFFYIGEKAFLRPDIVKEAAARGFGVGIHSFTHAQSADSSRPRLSAELNSTGYILSQITGTTPEFYRPPFLLGIGIDPTINPYIPTSDDMKWSLELGYLPVGSDIDPRDWLATTPEQVVEGLTTALSETQNGHIILLHEDVNTAKAMPAILALLKNQGYQIVPLQDLITPPTEVSLANALHYGDTNLSTGGEVSKLQWFLYANKYLDPYALSGVFDDATLAALSRFQLDHHLVNEGSPYLGVAGPDTRDLIHQISASSAPAPAAAAITAGSGVFGTVLQNAYVRFFPIMTAFLAGMVLVTLVLVVARLLALLGIYIYGRLLTKEEVQSVHASSVRGVSVLIPAYNEQENIAATVESVLKSTYRPFEVIVINDGSKDNTGNEVRGVIEANPTESIRLIEVENGGKARALNIGTEVAQYDIVTVLDADAVLDAHALSRFVRHFEDSSIAAVAGKVLTTGTYGLFDLMQSLEYAVGQNIDKRIFSIVGAVGVVPGPAGAWRRSLLLASGGFKHDTLVEDQDMTLTMLRMGNHVKYEPTAVAYTETPHTMVNFLKQRFRWVFGTMQCFWKHKAAMLENPTSPLSVIVLPNIFVYNIVLPLTYPFADFAFIFGIVTGQWQTIVLPFAIFTLVDMAYAMLGLWSEPQKARLVCAVPLQRLIYRPLIYYTVAKGIIRALEGGGTGWNKFTKVGETKRFFQALGAEPAHVPVPTPLLSPEPVLAYNVVPQVVPEEVTISFQGPGGTAAASTNLQDVVSLSIMPRQSHMAGETSSPAWAPNVLTGNFAEPKT
jgi:cellulose synthase/poly-beta-1,6-N-acetylglucosamine synthase-like glycosyltransferase/peptidoglycan/xylan/chitin deacetylase (PgdA/CDA1 family)